MDVEIGDAAGQVYRFLEENGASTLAAISKGTGLKNQFAALAIGWLAREHKVCREKKGKSERWTLTDECCC